MNPADYSWFKTLGFFACLFTFLILQWLFPMVGRPLSAFWSEQKRNFLLGIAGAVLAAALCGGCIQVWTEELKAKGFGLFHWVPMPLAIEVILGLLILDLVTYFWHRAFHQFPLLWRFHAVHHSDRAYDASTAIRFHPGEILLSLLVRLLAIGLFGFSLLTYLVFELAFQFFNIGEHANLRLPRRIDHWLGYVFITPALHRRHHINESRDLNSNFATIFSFWDRIFGTLNVTADPRGEVGLPGEKRQWSVKEIFLRPFYQRAN